MLAARTNVLLIDLKVNSARNRVLAQIGVQNEKIGSVSEKVVSLG
jgi:hypothetical protein